MGQLRSTEALNKNLPHVMNMFDCRPLRKIRRVVRHDYMPSTNSSVMSKSLDIGDIIEIPTSKGLTYAQYTHDGPRGGSVICIFDALFEKRPDDFSLLVDRPVRFLTLFPLHAAINRNIFEIVAHERIALDNQISPIFCASIVDFKTQKVIYWRFWDGQKEWHVGKYAFEPKEMTVRHISDDRLLVKRVGSPQLPTTDVARWLRFSD